MNETETMNVLIAEDDALINEGIANQVTRLGYIPAGQAYDAVQAVELTCQRHPSVVLMDLQMIDPATGREDALAGLKATRTIQQRCPSAVVVLTAHESPALLRQATEAGVSGYLLKPVRDQDLDRMLTIARARFGELLKLRWKAGNLEHLNAEMREALAGAKTLSGLLSVCAWCRRVRDDLGMWQELEIYLRQHSAVTFSHGVCPECRTRTFPKTGPDASNS